MSIVVLGEALVDFIQDEEGRYYPHLGGSPYNFAIGLARQEMDVGYLSPISDDVFGDQICNQLSKEGIAQLILKRSSDPTSLAFVSIDSRTAGPSYRFYRAGVADKDVTFDELYEGLPESVDLFHTGSLAITPSQIPKISKLLDVLRQRGVKVSLDLNIRLGASKNTRAYIAGVMSLVSKVDVIKASDEDIALLNICTDQAKAAHELFNMMSSGLFLLTRGSKGVTLYCGDYTIEKPAFPVQDFKDTIGAGDSFYAAFIAELMRSGCLERAEKNYISSEVDKALDMACAGAAINISKTGCQPPSYEDVSNYMKLIQYEDEFKVVFK